MALIDDVLDRLQGSKVFTTLDLANEFFHVPIEVESRKFTSFVTHNGQYEFTHVPFGILPLCRCCAKKPDAVQTKSSYQQQMRNQDYQY